MSGPASIRVLGINGIESELCVSRRLLNSAAFGDLLKCAPGQLEAWLNRAGPFGVRVRESAHIFHTTVDYLQVLEQAAVMPRYEVTMK